MLSVSKAGNRDSQDSNEHYLTEERHHQMLFLLSCTHHSFAFSDLSLGYTLYLYPSACEQVHLYSESILSHI